MKKTIFLSAIILSNIIGCANINPKLDFPFRNEGRVDEIKNNQNGIIAEVGKLKQGLELQNSQLKDLQQGLLNLNASISKNDNSGIQILQGDGALIMVFSLVVIGMLFYYRNKAVKSEQINDIMAKEVAKINDPVLNENILKSAVENKSGKKVYNMIKKHIV